MKKYTNHSNELRCIRFTDGTSQFLMRGNSIETAKEPKKIPMGVKVKDALKFKRTRTKKDEDTQEQAKE